MRVSISAIGSVCISATSSLSTTPGISPLQRVAAETDAAHLKLAQKSARAAADAAAVALADLELQLPLHLRN
jgi:hypothetical protein